LSSSHDGGLRADWPLLAAGFAINFVLLGGLVETISVFVHAIAEAEGWSRSSLSMGVTVAAVSAALATPGVGVAVDRWGVRLPMAFGLGALGVGFLMLVRMTEPWHWMLAQLSLGVGFAFGAVFPITIAVTIRVRRRTAFALGLVSAGASAGALVMAPLLQSLVDAVGWRDTYVVLGCAAVAIPAPFILFALPRGPLQGGRAGAAVAMQKPLRVLASDLRHPAVRALATLMFFPPLVSFGIHVHLVGFLTDLGNPSRVAAAALGLAVGVSALGKLAGGLAGDRFGVLGTFRIALVLEAVAIGALAFADTRLALGAFTLAHGLALGSRTTVISVIALRVLGHERFALRYGLLQLVTTMGAAVGPLVPGAIFDRTGAYSGAVAFWLAVIFVAIAIGFRLRLPAGDDPGSGGAETVAGG